jgi:hypothetical protein
MDDFGKAVTRLERIPTAGSTPITRIDMHRGEQSPATSLNIGGRDPDPIQDVQFPEEAMTRAGGDLQFKGYGQGTASRQLRTRQAQC